MPTRKIAELEDALPKRVTCSHPDHEPPTEAEVRVPGVYEHVCTGCGTTTVFSVGGDPNHPLPKRSF